MCSVDRSVESTDRCIDPVGAWKVRREDPNGGYGIGHVCYVLYQYEPKQPGDVLVVPGVGVVHLVDYTTNIDIQTLCVIR